MPPATEVKFGRYAPTIRTTHVARPYQPEVEIYTERFLEKRKPIKKQDSRKIERKNELDQDIKKVQI